VGTDSSDLNAGTGANVNITGTTAEFDAALPDNIGVGDVLQYNPGSGLTVAFISGRTDADTFTVQSSTGGIPTETSGSVAVNIYRAHLELNDWEQQTVNTSIDVSVASDVQVNTTLTAIMNVACYYASNVDDAAVTIDGWTTSSSNYIRIYTPTSSSEVGTSQRHGGVWNTTSAYRLVVAGDAIIINDEHVRIEGLQIEVTTGWDDAILVSSDQVTEIYIGYNILKGQGNIEGQYGINCSTDYGVYDLFIYNNIVYDFNHSTNDNTMGIRTHGGDPSGATAYIYNNTVYNCHCGICTNKGTNYLKNNAVLSSTKYDYYEWNINAGSTNNASSDETGNAGGAGADGDMANGITGVVATDNFVDPANGNFHLKSDASDLKDAGVSDPGSGLFSGDIDGETRLGTWDIGADEIPFCDYSYRRRIKIESDEVIGSSDLTNFPVLIRLSGNWLKTTTADPTNGRIENANGYDIIFKDTGGTQLDHEIEEYDGSASGGTLVAWVRIPTLDHDDDTFIYMFYGSIIIMIKGGDSNP